MIFVTGDTHGSSRLGLHSVDGVIPRFNMQNFPEQKEMTKEDFVVILGDFGCIWAPEKENKDEKYALDWLNDKPFTTLFIDGNHENFERLYKYPEREWHGGRVHQIRPSVLHLMRGYVFNLCGQKCFAFGGASSHDIADGILNAADPDWKKKAKRLDSEGKWRYRIYGLTWWPQELPSEDEMERGVQSLKAENNQVDMIFTHTPAGDMYPVGQMDHNKFTAYLEEIHGRISYSHWFCGHMHENRNLSAKDLVLYEQIIRVY